MPIPVAIITNSAPPYRIAFHRRLIRECPEYDIYSIFTHDQGSAPWRGGGIDDINAISFGNGDSSETKAEPRNALREYRRAGRIIRWLQDHEIEAVVIGGSNDVGYLRIMRWCHRVGVSCFLFADSNIHGDTATGLRRLAKNAVMACVRRWCAGVLVCGSLGRAYFERYGFPSEQIFFMPYEPDYGLIHDMPAAAIDTAIRELGLDQARRRIVFSGRLVPVKRPQIALEAFLAIAERRPAWDLVVVGDGPLRATLESLVPENLMARVRWTGFLDDQRCISAIYRASDVLVLPSEKEPWGLVVNEAVAAGMAVVCTDIVGAGAELVESAGNGWTRPRSATAQEWAEALLAMTADDRIELLKSHSAIVLDRWQRKADPVAGFRSAMTTI
jgi:glycosyltransferase involved in cell wall biosynthesis